MRNKKENEQGKAVRNTQTIKIETNSQILINQRHNISYELNGLGIKEVKLLSPVAHFIITNSKPIDKK